MPGGEGPVGEVCEPPDAGLQQALEPGPHHVEGQVKDQGHDAHEGGDGRVFAREEPVDLLAAGVLLALPGLDHRLGAELLDEGEAHIGDGGGPVQAPFLLHLLDDVFQHLLFVLGEMEGLQDQGIPLHQLAGGKAQGEPGQLGVVLDEVHDAVEAAVDRAAVVVLVAEIRAARPLLILGDVDGVAHQLLYALVFGGHDGHHRDAQ